jgi:hypothetical protein
MMGTKERNFRSLPEDISLEDLVAEDNFYRRLDEKLDLSFVRELDGFRCAMGERTAIGICSPIRFGLWSASSITEPPPFGLWCPGWPSALPTPPIYQNLPRLYPGNGSDIRGAS